MLLLLSLGLFTLLFFLFGFKEVKQVVGLLVAFVVLKFKGLKKLDTLLVFVLLANHKRSLSLLVPFEQVIRRQVLDEVLKDVGDAKSCS